VAASLRAVLTVYEKPTCTTCRKLAQLLTDRGVDFERVDFHIEPLPEERIRELLAKAGLRPRDALRTREPVYAELALGEREVGDDELFRLMAEHPQLLQRPIVELDDRAVLARPPERVETLFDS
jgi:arsenate reductase (glutaredoxin)